MSVLIDQHGLGLVNDVWQPVSPDTNNPALSPYRLVPFSLLPDQASIRSGLDHPIGVALSTADDDSRLRPFLPKIALIAFRFDKFTDGRGYTFGRIIRERWKFTGILRATGQLGADQVVFLRRCGYTEFELPNLQIAQTAMGLLRTAGLAYQPAATNTRVVPLPGPERSRAAQHLKEQSGVPDLSSSD